MDVRTSKLVAALTLILTPIASATADDGPKAFVIDGCKPFIQDFYPSRLIDKGVEGRVLLEVERSVEGRIRVLSVEVSNPAGAFDKAVTNLMTSWKCPKLQTPRVGRVSVTFSLAGHDPFPHFDGVDDQISITGTVIHSSGVR